MSATFDKVRALAAVRKVRVSQHGLIRLARRGIAVAEVAAGVAHGEPIEDYPSYHMGPAVLVLQANTAGLALHVVWGIEVGTDEPAVIVTAYRPEPAEWSADFRSRKP